MGKSTITVSRHVCPECGKNGEQKLRWRGAHLYMYIDHYSNGKYYHNGNYSYSCYIGRIDYD